MQRIPVLIGTVLLIALPGFAETLVTARDYAVDSDVVLESVVSEVKSIPQDTINIVGDAVKYVSDETITAANGVAAVFKSNPVEAAEREAALETASAWDSSNDIVFRSYKIAPQVGKDLLAAGTKAENDPAVDVRGFFNGIQFSKDTSAFYRPEFKRLLVHQTLANVLAIEAILAEHHNAHRKLMGHQVEIETKFIEVSQQTLNELGFSWTFENHNGGPLDLFGKLQLPAGTPILSDGLRTAASAFNGRGSDTMKFFRDGSIDLGLVIKAMEQADDSDVLSAPRIVTRNGQEAVIQVGEEQMFPDRFRASTMDVSPIVEHLDWNLKLTGVQMKVTPKIREGGLIDLKLNPKVIDLIGFDSYVVTPPYKANTIRIAVTALGFPLPTDALNALSLGAENYLYRPNIPEVTGSLPYFRAREMETEVSVADGSTVGMGGLIYEKLETFRDKVPLLGSIPLIGRLFRSEGERSTKRNLMIFVTATQVDVNGRRSADLALKK